MRVAAEVLSEQLIFLGLPLAISYPRGTRELLLPYILDEMHFVNLKYCVFSHLVAATHGRCQLVTLVLVLMITNYYSHQTCFVVLTKSAKVTGTKFWAKRTHSSVVTSSFIQPQYICQHESNTSGTKWRVASSEGIDFILDHRDCPLKLSVDQREIRLHNLHVTGLFNLAGNPFGARS